VIRVLREESEKHHVHSYQSYTGSPLLRRAMADWYRQWYLVELDPATQILPLMGSKEGILHICMTYINKGDRALIPDPGYPTYASAVKLAGGEAIPYSLEEKNFYEPDFGELEKENLEKVKLLFVNYPHMPTGALASFALFEKIIAFAAKHKIMVVHDNPYSFLLPGREKPMSMLCVPGAIEQVLELNSLSKSHNMAGWRVGMLCGQEQRIKEVLRFKSNMDSGMFLPVQLAAAKALQLEPAWYELLRSEYRLRREIVFRLLDELGCTYKKQQAGLFAWARVPGKCRDGFALSDELLEQAGVFIAPGGIFGKEGKKYVRVSLCSPVERLEEAVNCIKSISK
jgi:aspartate/methionine/tyrosine aminotransferase